MSRPTDHLQPSGKRRPGEQLTKDNAGDSDEDGPATDPGTWGKADEATMARRKVIRAKRGAAAAEPAQAAPQAVDNQQAAGGNPFAGVSLTTAAPPAANPFAGVSLLAPKPAEATPSTAPTAGKAEAAGSEEAAAANKAEEPAAAELPKEQAAAEESAKAATVAAETADKAADAIADATADKPAAQDNADMTDKPAEASEQKDSAATAPAAAPLFGGAGGGFGGFGGFGATAAGGGFGATGGFGGFAAAAKDNTGAGSLFGNYTAPKPGASLFNTVPAFGAARQSKDGEEDATEAAEGDGEGNAEVFGGENVQPVVQLSEVPKQTGEEDEETVYAADGALFEFVNGKEWRERGKGELRLNTNKATKQARMVMRQRGSQRLLLNARLYPKMTTSKMLGGKGVTFAAVNAAAASAAAGDAAAGQESKEENASQPEAGSSGGGAAHAMRTYALKVKNAEKIDEFVVAVDEHKVGPAGNELAAADDKV